MSSDYTLEDVEQRHRDAPRTFSIPRSDERARLQPGQLVKLIFVLTSPGPEAPRAERMWVEITSGGPSDYRGRLNSRPQHIDTIATGDELAFEARHVASVYVTDSDGSGVDDDGLVAVDIRVALGGQWPRHAVRVEPRNPRDSGWRVLADDATAAALVGCEVEAVSTAWAVLDSVFGEPPGTAWRWDDDAVEYVAATLDPPWLADAVDACRDPAPLPELGLGAITSARATEPGFFPRYVAHDEPTGEQDSGWQLLAGDESEHELTVDTAGIRPLRFFVHRWLIVASILGEEGAWLWDDDSQQYVPAGS